ncbi:MAG: glycosyltransferase family 39 protein [Waterburya sp.]
MVSNKILVNQTSWTKFAHYLSFGLLLFGILVRIVQYFHNRSLWGDELSLAFNILDRSYGELAQTLDLNQSAPLGFLWLEKLATQWLGNSEYALRLLPLIASIISLVVFYRLVRRYSSLWAAPMAIALFACTRFTLYFSTELKPYSSDVAIALILVWLITSAQHRRLQVKEMLVFASLGSLAIWLSYPAVLVMAGMEGWNLLTAPSRAWGKILLNRLGVYVVWLINFGLFYLINIADALSNENLSSSWADRYPDSFLDLVWLLDALAKFFYHPMGFLGITDGIGMFAFIVGCVAWYRHHRTIFFALIAPFVANIIAAYLHQYPFQDRLTLFLAPFGMMIVAEGIVLMLRYSHQLFRGTSSKVSWLMGLLGIISLSTLVIFAIYRAGTLMVKPELKQEVRPVLEYVAAQNQPGDKVYVYKESDQAFLYYSRLNNYDHLNYTLGEVNFDREEEEKQNLQQDLGKELQPLKGHRVWFIIRANPDNELAIIEYLDRIGQRQESLQQQGASGHLYFLE